MPVNDLALGEALRARLHEFCFPGGENSARTIRSIRTTQNGEMRMSPDARWIPFTATEYIAATHSHFRWEARLDPGKLISATVIDAYENGHGFLAVKLGGILPVKQLTGPDFDKGELQRYLSSVALCPAMLLNHQSLEWRVVGPSTLSIRDLTDTIGATVDCELADDGRPFAIRAIRPRLVGKNAILTPWLARAAEFREYHGLRVATNVEAAWQLPEGEFTYFREQINAIEIVD